MKLAATSLLFACVTLAQPPKTADEKFKEDWAKATAIVKELDKAEPDETAKALAKLGQREQALAGVAMAKAAGVDPSEGAADLLKYGLAANLNKESRRVAVENKEFKKVARTFWETDPDPKRIVSWMHRWGVIGSVNRALVVDAVENNRKPEEMTPAQLKAVAAAGGEKWLKR